MVMMEEAREDLSGQGAGCEGLLHPQGLEEDWVEECLRKKGRGSQCGIP